MSWGEHHGHCNDIIVKVGQHVSKGQVIAHVGKTGNASGPHDHLEVWRDDPVHHGYTFFPYGYSKFATQAIYDDPRAYFGPNLPFTIAGIGYNYLQYAAYPPKGNVYHPGVDCDAPRGTPIHALHDGVVVYVQLNNSGWGNHLFIKWDPAPVPPQGDADTMPINNSLDPNTLRKMKEMSGHMKPGTGDGADIEDYKNVLYGGKPLGTYTYQAFIDYIYRQYVNNFNKGK